MKTRIISAVVAIPLLLFFIIYGGLPLRVVTAVLSLIGMHELYKAVSGKIKVIHFVGFILEIVYSLCIILTFHDNMIIDMETIKNELSLCIMFFIPIFIIAMIIILSILVFDHKKCNIYDASITIFGFFYIGVLLSFICFIRGLGMFYVWLPFIFAFVSDTGAYFVGSFIGKHKLTSELSPKKTIEGSVGGIIAVALFTLVYTLLFNKFEYMYNPGCMEYSAALYVFAGIIGAILSQIGDLAASSIKRFRGIKDYGNLMPGHGGVLDRFDSVLFTIPLVFIVSAIDLIMG